MRTFYGLPHSITDETTNYMITCREMRLPDNLLYDPLPPVSQSVLDYTHDLNGQMWAAYRFLRKQQNDTVGGNRDEPLRFMKGDLVLLENRSQRNRKNGKLHPPFVGSFTRKEVCDNHTYKIDNQGQSSVQNERRLKLFRPSEGPKGQAPVTETVRRPNIKRAVKRRPPQPTLLEEPSEALQPMVGMREETGEAGPVEPAMSTDPPLMLYKYCK